MKPDVSKTFYEIYISRNNRLIEVTLKNGQKKSGVFISFFPGEHACNEPYIRRWHMVDEKYKMTIGIDAFGLLIGEYINQKDIKSIKFLDVNSEIQFE